MPKLDLDAPHAERQLRLAAELRQCDGPGLKRLARAALMWLEVNHGLVNALNVFPVPDGDTGTNMLLTMQAAYKEIATSTEPTAGKMAHAIAHGALMGARGNSGVILSQIWRGFARGVDGLEEFDADGFVKALDEARDTAYRGVVKPVEGTILTVIKEVAQEVSAARANSADLRYLLGVAVTSANAAVARTPELLPVLKQAGVVDSGGKGFALVLEGMLRYVKGQPLDQAVERIIAPLNLAAVGAAMDAVEPGQEWEVVVDFRPQRPPDLPLMYGRLEQMGTSIQVGEGDGVFRVHVHLLKSRRYEPIEFAEELGTVLNVHMENLLDQMEQKTAQTSGGEEPLPLAQVQPGQIGVIAVSPGVGLSRVLASLGVAAIIAGGQTMNPSTQDMLEAIASLPTAKIILLPNNKNIILAAKQAVELVTDKQVAVVPTRTVPQGIAALLSLVPEGEVEEVRAAMERAMTSVETGEITMATRTVELDGVAVRDGQIIGLHNGSLRIARDNVTDALLSLLEIMHARDRELLTLYHGAEVTSEQAATMADTLRAAYPNQIVEMHAGGQPHYHYILSAE